jgi:hypothetical protein
MRGKPETDFESHGLGAFRDLKTLRPIKKGERGEGKP